MLAFVIVSTTHQVGRLSCGMILLSHERVAVKVRASAEENRELSGKEFNKKMFLRFDCCVYEKAP